jgi:NAD(P)-dependent dehydrogenase (short-subunit alcohol dehydrogenase family)
MLVLINLLVMKKGCSIERFLLSKYKKMKKEKIAVVTGASRGAGKGIAIALGKSGATVYVTGRPPLNQESDESALLATAKEITDAGGLGIAVYVDHADDHSVETLFERIKSEHGKLDILVNNAASVSMAVTKKIPFWENSLDQLEILNIGLRSHYISSYYAAPMLIANGKGLIVNTGQYAAVSYYHGPVYGAQKAGSDKMAADMAKELRPYNVACISVWMGFLDTERSRAYISALAEHEKPTAKRESPQFTGMVINALYESPKLMEVSGQALIGAELGEKFGVRDVVAARFRTEPQWEVRPNCITA